VCQFNCCIDLGEEEEAVHLWEIITFGQNVLNLERSFHYSNCVTDMCSVLNNYLLNVSTDNWKDKCCLLIDIFRKNMTGFIESRVPKRLRYKVCLILKCIGKNHIMLFINITRIGIICCYITLAFKEKYCFTQYCKA
jgi:hypothetical protein